MCVYFSVRILFPLLFAVRRRHYTDVCQIHTLAKHTRTFAPKGPREESNTVAEQGNGSALLGANGNVCVSGRARARESEREGEHARNGNGRFAVGRIVGGKRTRTQTLATTRTNTRSITRLCRLSTDTQQRTHPLAGVLFALRLWVLSLPLSGFWGFRVVRRCGLNPMLHAQTLKYN